MPPCASSRVCVWDMDAGQLSYTLEAVHGTHKVTAMALDR